MRPENMNIEARKATINAEAEFTIDGLNYIITGDERFYGMIGEFSFFSFDKIVHDKDRERFLEFMEDDKEYDIVLRCRFKDKKYHVIRLLKVDSRMVGNDRINTLILQDMVNVCVKFREYFDIVKKYRTFLDILPNKFFDYEIKTGIITVFYYNNHISQPIMRMQFNDWKKYVIENNMIDNRSLKNFDILCECIENQMENFSISIRSSMLSSGIRMENLSIKGQTLMEKVENQLVLGVITQEKYQNEVIIKNENSDVGMDSATGLYNKKTVTDIITDRLNKMNQEGTRLKNKVYLLVLDIDNFKQVNDTYGHYFGDEVIKSFAKGLNHMAANKGIVGRIGGDEFIVLLDKVKDEEELRIMLKSMRVKLKLDLKEEKPDYLFSSSIGISEFGKDGNDFEKLFKISDACLYIAKDKGKDRFIIYDFYKHGDLLSGETVRVATGNDVLKPIDKYEMAIRMVLKASKVTSDEELVEILDELGDKLNLHGIRVFAGEKLKNIYNNGHYKNELSDALYINSPEYSAHFDKHDMYVVNNVATIEVLHPELAHIFKENNICSFIQARVMTEEGKCIAMIEFDIFGEIRRKWSSADISTLRMVVMGLSQVSYRYNYQIKDL